MSFGEKDVVAIQYGVVSVRVVSSRFWDIRGLEWGHRVGRGRREVRRPGTGWWLLVYGQVVSGREKG